MTDEQQQQQIPPTETRKRMGPTTNTKRGGEDDVDPINILRRICPKTLAVGDDSAKVDNVSEEMVEIYEKNGVQYARVTCGLGKIPDYKNRKCIPINPYNTPCKKGEVYDPYTQKCVPIPEIRPRPGVQWTPVGHTYMAKNIGIPLQNDVWSYLRRLPIAFRLNPERTIPLKNDWQSLKL